MNQKYFDLTLEEQKVLDSYEAGEWKSVPNLDQAKELLKKYAKNSLDKTKNINLRLSQRTVFKLKVKAIAEGIPYQTLASSVLHKYVSNLAKA